MVIPSPSGSPSPSTQPVPQNAEPPDVAVAADNRKISAAVKLLNDSGAVGRSHEFSIAIDPQTRRAVVRIVDRSTKEVVEQLPSEYLLQVAQQISERLAQQSASRVDKAV